MNYEWEQYHCSSAGIPLFSMMKRNTSLDYQSPQPSILNWLRWLLGRVTDSWCTIFGFCGLYNTSIDSEGILKVSLRKVRSSKARSGTLYSMVVRRLLRERLQRYMGASTKRVAMGVQMARRQILEGSYWYLSYIAAGMNKRPAMMTKQPCRRAVLVVSLVRVEAFQRGIWLSLFSRILLRRREISWGVRCFCLKLSSNSQSGINKQIIISQQYNCPILPSIPIFPCLLSPSLPSFSIPAEVNKKQILIINPMSQPHQKGISFKVILIGDSGTGKTSLIHQYIHGKFKDEYQVTVGVDFSSKIVVIDDQPVQLQIWDTCGQDIYKAITNNFYRGAAAVFLVYAIDNRESFDRLKQWLEEFYEKGSAKAFVFVIATKCDLQREVQAQQGFSFLKSINGTFFIETSAKESIKVDELFHKAAETMYKYYDISKEYRDLVKPERMTMSVMPNSRITLTGSLFEQPKKSKKCC